MTPFSLEVIRALFGVGERIAPSLMGRIAFELFCRTPNVNRPTEGERRVIERAAGFMTQARLHRLDLGSVTVAAHEFPPKPGRGEFGVVLVVHGWRSRTEFMRSFIEGFCDAGYRVVSLDLPGHGQSSGRRLHLVAALEAVQAAAVRFGPFAAIVGHSFGGAVATSASVGAVRGVAPVETDRLVLIAAPSSMQTVFDNFSAMMNVGPRSRAAMDRIVERIAGRPLADFVGSRLLADVAMPVLVIHARDDKEVSSSHAEDYGLAGGHVQIFWADGLGHRRILSDSGVIAKALDFVSRPASDTDCTPRAAAG